MENPEYGSHDKETIQNIMNSWRVDITPQEGEVPEPGQVRLKPPLLVGHASFRPFVEPLLKPKEFQETLNSNPHYSIFEKVFTPKKEDEETYDPLTGELLTPKIIIPNTNILRDLLKKEVPVVKDTLREILPPNSQPEEFLPAIKLAIKLTVLKNKVVAKYQSLKTRVKQKWRRSLNVDLSPLDLSYESTKSESLSNNSPSKESLNHNNPPSNSNEPLPLDVSKLLSALSKGDFEPTEWLAAKNFLIYRSNLLVTLRPEPISYACDIPSIKKYVELYYGGKCLLALSTPSRFDEATQIDSQAEDMALTELSKAVVYNQFGKVLLPGDRDYHLERVYQNLQRTLTEYDNWGLLQFRPVYQANKWESEHSQKVINKVASWTQLYTAFTSPGTAQVGLLDWTIQHYSYLHLHIQKLPTCILLKVPSLPDVNDEKFREDPQQPIEKTFHALDFTTELVAQIDAAERYLAEVLNQYTIMDSNPADSTIAHADSVRNKLWQILERKKAIFPHQKIKDTTPNLSFESLLKLPRIVAQNIILDSPPNTPGTWFYDQAFIDKVTDAYLDYLSNAETSLQTIVDSLPQEMK